MAIAELRLLGGERFEVDGSSTTGVVDAPLAFQELVSTGALASQPVPVDPMDAAFVTLDRHRHIEATGLRDRGVLERTHGLTPTLLAVTNVWRFEDSAELTVAAKGAPEAIAALSLLTPEERNRLTDSAEEMGQKGLRVLAVAKASVKSGVLTDTPHGYRFTILGLVGLADPLRENVKESDHAMPAPRAYALS